MVIKARCKEGIYKDKRSYFRYFSNSRLRFRIKYKRERKPFTLESYLAMVGAKLSDFDECIIINGNEICTQ